MGLITETGSAYYSGSNLGGYQFTSLENIIDQFIIAYVGEDKIISKVRKQDVVFHAKRGLQELSFDVFKSTKAFEIVVPATLQMSLPQDYVNYVKLSYTDSSGIEHNLYPARVTSNPEKITQGADGSYTFSGDEIQTSDSTTWDNYKSNTPSENNKNDFDYDDNIPDYNIGRRYGIDPAHAQVNGSYYIDELKGKIHFSSNLSGETITLKYISDSLGTDAEMQVHKFAEEAMYKYIAYAILSTRANVPINTVLRFKKEAAASKRQAKLRLSNIKLEEITQILRGKSKRIKH
jgi:hypothetical protein|tara:strand:+ start:1247 stop:2119 length:873 start_codon:yes stop_codon:yes gene_type:complete